MWSMYWDVRSFWRASEENGGPLSENLLGGHIGKLNFVIFNNGLGCFGRCLVNEGIFTKGKLSGLPIISSNKAEEGTS